MHYPFDLVVLGSGAASGAAERCRKQGWRVGVIDDQLYGGTCSLRGCDPKKVLVGAADVADWVRRMSGHGLSGDASLDWPALMRFKRSFTDPVPERRERALTDAGVVTYHGVASFVDEDLLEIGGDILEAKHFVIATGATPAPLGIPGEQHVRTSTDFLELEELPKRIVFIGGGYISFEFAHIAQRAGARTTLISRGSPLALFDRELVERLVSHTRNIGVELYVESAVTSIEAIGGAYRIQHKTANGGGTVEADLVVHGAGRVPNTANLHLSAANVATDARGAIAVNQYLQSISNPRVYAAGDVVLPEGSLPLTPVGAHESAIVASNLLHGNTKTPDYRGIPSVVFTIPPLASVGITETAATAGGLRVEVKCDETTSWYSSRRVRAPAGMFKTIVDTDTDRVLGAHLLGPHADEVINIFALAIRNDLTARALRQMIYAYPTGSSDIAYML